GRVRSECQACAFHRRSSGSAAPLPAKAGTCPRAAGLAARASGSAGIPAARPPSSRPCRGYPCSFSLASARPEGSGVHTPAPSRRSLPSARFCVPPSALPRSALLSGLHPYPPAVAPVAWTSEALPFRDPQPFRSPLRSVLRRSRLLRPLLTSRSASASPFQAQGESSPGKNSVLRRTTAGFTPPEPRPSELRGSLPARPARRRLGSGSCTSAHGFAPRFLPTVGHPSAVAVRFDRDGLLSAGLPPARQRPCWAHKRNADRREPVGVLRCRPRRGALGRGGELLGCLGCARHFGFGHGADAHAVERTPHEDQRDGAEDHREGSGRRALELDRELDGEQAEERRELDDGVHGDARGVLEGIA